jgi:hypothetical protein
MAPNWHTFVLGNTTIIPDLKNTEMLGHSVITGENIEKYTK